MFFNAYFSSSLVGKNFLSLKDFSGEELKKMLWVAADLKYKIKQQNEVSNPILTSLAM